MYFFWTINGAVTPSSTPSPCSGSHSLSHSVLGPSSLPSGNGGQFCPRLQRSTGSVHWSGWETPWAAPLGCLGLALPALRTPCLGGWPSSWRRWLALPPFLLPAVSLCGHSTRVGDTSRETRGSCALQRILETSPLCASPSVPPPPPCQPQETRPFASAQAHLCHPQSVIHSILHSAQCFSKCGQHHQLHLGTCSKCKFLDPTPDLLSQKLWSGTQHKPSRC